LTTDTSTYNFGYTQGFLTGTQLAVTFNNTRVTTNNPFSDYSPDIDDDFPRDGDAASAAGFWPGRQRPVHPAGEERPAHYGLGVPAAGALHGEPGGEHLLGLVSAYEDEQAKERSLAQSTQLTSDNRKQLEIGTLAPLDVVNSDSSVASDKQALIASKSNLEYQQLIMKQAIARNLNDPQLSAAPVIPTDRVGLDRLPEEDMQVEDLVKQAYVEQPADRAGGVEHEEQRDHDQGGEERPAAGRRCVCVLWRERAGWALRIQRDELSIPDAAYTRRERFRRSATGRRLANLFNSTAPDKGVGVNITIPMRNRTAQADQARSQMEYRQSQMRLQQLYTQIRIQVINGQYALTNDRAQVQAAQAARDFAAQSLDAEQKKYKLGASTTAQCAAAGKESCNRGEQLDLGDGGVCKDRAALQQLLSTTLDRVRDQHRGDSATGDGGRRRR
jgi:outer membrane protein